MTTLAVAAMLASPQFQRVGLATHPFHQYSYIQDAGSFAYTGVHSVRPDVAVTKSNPGPCAAVPYVNNPMYFTQWVSFDDANDTGVELGTGHGCTGQRYYFWGYTFQGTWFPQGEDWSVPLNTDTWMDLHRSAEVWYWNINGANKYTRLWNAVGSRSLAGLESWDGHANSPWVTVHTINKTLSESAWIAFNGAGFVDANMCGVRLAPDKWQERQPAQGTPC